jgi:hypothetical protein
MDDFIRMIQGSQWKEEHAKYFSIQEKSGIWKYSEVSGKF